MGSVDQPDSLRMTPDDEQFLDELAQEVVERPHWIQIGVLHALRLALDAVRASFTTPDRIMGFFEHPTIALRFQIRWHGLLLNVEDSWDRGERQDIANRSYASRPQLLDV